MSWRHPLTGHSTGCCCFGCEVIPFTPTQAAKRVRELEAGGVRILADLEALAREWQHEAEIERDRYPDIAARRDADAAQVLNVVARARRCR
jgi:hypothetical protein